jgi:hypothetical protein
VAPEAFVLIKGVKHMKRVKRRRAMTREEVEAADHDCYVFLTRVYRVGLDALDRDWRHKPVAHRQQLVARLRRGIIARHIKANLGRGIAHALRAIMRAAELAAVWGAPEYAARWAWSYVRSRYVNNPREHRAEGFSPEEASGADDDLAVKRLVEVIFSMDVF